MALLLLFMSMAVTGVTAVPEVDGEVEMEERGKAKSRFLLSSSA